MPWHNAPISVRIRVANNHSLALIVWAQGNLYMYGKLGLGTPFARDGGFVSGSYLGQVNVLIKLYFVYDRADWSGSIGL